MGEIRIIYLKKGMISARLKKNESGHYFTVSYLDPDGLIPEISSPHYVSAKQALQSMKAMMSRVGLDLKERGIESGEIIEIFGGNDDEKGFSPR